MASPFEFILAVLVILATPGPTNTVMATAGASNREQGPWLFVAGELVGYFTIVLLARLLLLPLIAAWPPLELILKLAVVSYLLYAAVRLWRTGVKIDENERKIGPLLVFTTTLLNPKGLIFALSIIPKEHPMLWAFFAGFAALIVVVGSLWFLFGKGLAALSGEHARVIPRVGATALIGFAGYLALSLVH
jgi:threonine/homoserine/homoserine lactone efflux protein